MAAFSLLNNNPYPVGYEDTKTIATAEFDNNTKPAIKERVENMDDYDIVFVGYPIWYGKIPMILHTFLDGYDFAGKTVIPFCTSAGSGMGGSVSEITRLCSGATVLDGFGSEGKTAQESRDRAREVVNSWLNKKCTLYRTLESMNSNWCLRRKLLTVGAELRFDYGDFFPAAQFS